MRIYELTCLLTSQFSEKEASDFSQEISEIIKKEGGSVNQIISPKKQKLGYPIKKETEAFLLTIDFSLSPEKIKSLEEKFKRENRILRYILLSKKATKEPILKESSLASEKIPASTSSGPEKSPKKPEKVELKEIDKKLEEILNE